MARTADSVGGTTGSPSLQPRSKQKSTAAAMSSTLKRLDVSVPGMTALLVPAQTGDATLPPATASPQPRALTGAAQVSHTARTLELSRP